MSKTNYDIIKTIASLAEEGGIEEMGIYKRGNKGWEIAIYTGERYANGRKKYHREFVKTKKEAIQRYGELMAELQDMKQTIQEIQVDLKRADNEQLPKSLPFAKAAKEWLLKKEFEVRKTTYEGYKIIVEKHLIPYFRDTDIASIEDIDVMEYFSSKSDLSGTTLGHHFSSLRMILRSKNNHCMQDIKRPRGSSFEAQPIRNKAELKQFVEGFKDNISYLPTYIAATTGMRLSEIAGLQWKDIDFQRGLIRVRRSLHWGKNKQTGERTYYIDKTKTRASARDIIVGKRITAELERIKNERGNQKPDDFVCIDTNENPIDRCNTYDAFKRRAKKLGYSHLRFHDLRHSHATIAIHEEGLDPASVQGRLGHGHVSTTLSTYTVKSVEQDRKIAAIFDF